MAADASFFEKLEIRVALWDTDCELLRRMEIEIDLDRAAGIKNLEGPAMRVFAGPNAVRSSPLLGRIAQRSLIGLRAVAAGRGATRETSDATFR